MHSSFKSALAVATLAALGLAAVGPTLAQTPAYSANLAAAERSVTDGNSYTGAVGFEFTVGAHDLSVSGLGFFDDGGTLSESHAVGIYQNDRTLIGQATVNAGSYSPESFAYAAPTSNFTLFAGQQYFIAASLGSNADAFLDTDQNHPVTPGTGLTINGAVYSSTTDGGLSFPDQGTTGTANTVFAGPNFLAAPAQPTAPNGIQVNNFSFEGPVLPTGTGYNVNAIYDWTGTSGANYGAQSQTAYPTLFTAVPDGTQYAYVNAGGIYQDVAATLTAGTTYTLTGYVGTRSDGYSGAGTINLETSGGTVLASTTVTAPSGTFEQVNVVYTATAADAGQSLRIFLDRGSDKQANFDDISLSAVAAPEPSQLAGLALGAFGLGALALKARKRTA